MHTATGLRAVIEVLVASEYLERAPGMTEERALRLAAALLEKHKDEAATSASLMAMLREAREHAWEESR